MARIRPFLMTISLFLLSAVIVAQQSGTCSALVERALTAIGDNCTEMDRNSACYGFNRVDATFTETVEDDFFNDPSERTALQLLNSIQTAQLDLNNDIWGVSVLNLQANLPNTLPGQNIIFVLMGDTAVENAVSPDEAVVPGESILVTGLSGTNVRSSPSLNANVIGSLTTNTEMDADGLSEDGEWIRVVYLGRAAWIARSRVTTDGDVDSLTVMSADSRSPMQAVYLRTGVGQPGCEDVPDDALLVQGPENVFVDITVNGADIRLGSTVIIRLIEPGNQIELIVIDGVGIIFPDELNGQQISIPAGFKSTVCLGEDDNGNPVVTCGFSPPEPLTFEEWEKWQLLTLLDFDFMNYVPQYPSYGDIIAYFNALGSGGNNAGGGGSFSGNVSDTSGGQVDCSTLALNGPLGSAPDGPTNFSWSSVAGANRYRVNVFNENGGLGSSYETTATNISINTGAAGVGSIFSWQVQALASDGTVWCTLSSPAVERRAPTGGTGGGAGGAGFSADYSCSYTANYNVTINWTAAPGDSISLFARDIYFGTFNASAMGSGSKTFTSLYQFDFARITNNTTGAVLTLFSSPC